MHLRRVPWIPGASAPWLPESLLDAVVTDALQIPVVDRSVGGLPSRWGWSDTAIPTQSLQVTGKGMTDRTGLSMGADLSYWAVIHWRKRTQ